MREEEGQQQLVEGGWVQPLTELMHSWAATGQLGVSGQAAWVFVYGCEDSWQGSVGGILGPGGAAQFLDVLCGAARELDGGHGGGAGAEEQEVLVPVLKVLGSLLGKPEGAAILAGG